MSCEPPEASVLHGPSAAERVRRLGAAMTAYAAAPSPSTQAAVQEAGDQFAQGCEVGAAALALVKRIRDAR